MTISPVLHSSNDHSWQTPDVVLDAVRQVGPIVLDPATTAANPTGATRIHTPDDSGLEASWFKRSQVGRPIRQGLVFLNCPYGAAARIWVAKAVGEAALGTEILACLAARPDREWGQAILATVTAICYWRGRIKFRGAKAGAPFPSWLPYWGPHTDAFEAAFASHGRVEVFGQPSTVRRSESARAAQIARMRGFGAAVEAATRKALEDQGVTIG